MIASTSFEDFAIIVFEISPMLSYPVFVSGFK
jgi:hypothetical protein